MSNYLTFAFSMPSGDKFFNNFLHLERLSREPINQKDKISK